MTTGSTRTQGATTRWASLLLVVALVSIIPILFGWASVLLLDLPGGIPLGTLLAAVAIASAAGIPVLKSRPRSMVRYFALAVLAGGILWLPLGIFLSGNASLSFVQDARDSAFFWRYTGVLATATLSLLIWVLFRLLFAARAT